MPDCVALEERCQVARLLADDDRTDSRRGQHPLVDLGRHLTGGQDDTADRKEGDRDQGHQSQEHHLPQRRFGRALHRRVTWCPSTSPNSTCRCSVQGRPVNPVRAWLASAGLGVESEHGFIDALGGDGLHGIGGHDHRHVERLTLGLPGPVQDVVGTRLPARGLSDPDPHPDVPGLVQMGMDGLETVVPGGPTPHLDLYPSTGKVELVVDDDESGEIAHAVAAHQGATANPDSFMKVWGTATATRPSRVAAGPPGTVAPFSGRSVRRAARPAEGGIRPQIVAGPVDSAPGFPSPTTNRSTLDPVRGAPKIRRRLSLPRCRVPLAARPPAAVAPSAPSTPSSPSTASPASAPARLTGGHHRIGVEVGRHARGQHDVGNPYRGADDQIGDVRLEVGGNIRRPGADGQGEQLLVEDPVGPVKLQGLTHQGDRDFGVISRLGSTTWKSTWMTVFFTGWRWSSRAIVMSLASPTCKDSTAFTPASVLSAARRSRAATVTEMGSTPLP